MAGELILIVEDNEKNRKLVRDLLQFNGYETAESATAEEGIEIARAKGPALIIMDVQLPGMGGIEALGVLRADAGTQRIPVMALTASAMPEDRRKIEEAGFDRYETKPIDIKNFVADVREMLEAASPAAQGEIP